MDAATIGLIIGEALKLLNSLLNSKIEKDKITTQQKEKLLKEAKDAIDHRDYDRFFMALRRARRL